MGLQVNIVEKEENTKSDIVDRVERLDWQILSENQPVV